MKKIFLTMVLFLLGNLAIAQPNTKWYFGGYAGVDFSSGAPVSFNGSAMNTGEGCSVMTNYAGTTLFYTDGRTIWDVTNNPMPNANATLLGSGSATQSAIIVPWPDDSCNKYFVFTIPAVELNFSDGLNYSVVDMRLPGNGTISAPLGDVSSVKNVHLKDSVCEKLTAIAKPFPLVGFWVVAHGYGTTEGQNFYVYDIGPTGINAVPIVNTPIGTSMNLSGQQLGQMKISPDKNKIAMACFGSPYSVSPAFVEVFHFNATTGQITGTGSSAFLSIQGLQDPGRGGPYGLEFSSNSQYLYYTTTQSGSFDNVLYQIDLSVTAGSPYTASGSYTNWTITPTPSPLRSVYVTPTPASSPNYHLAALQLSPVGSTNKKIYVANRGLPYISEIQNADLATASYADNVASIAPNLCVLGLPTLIGGEFTCSGPLPARCTVTGGGHYCTGQPCPDIGLSCSTSGVSYQLLFNGTVLTGAPVSGSGSSISFGTQCTPGVYSVVATDLSTGSMDTMTGSAVVTVNTTPHLTSPLTIPTICTGDSVHYVPVSSVPGATFNWSRILNTGVLPSSAAGTGNINDYFTLATTTPVLVTYEIVMSDSGCVDSSAVTVLDSPCTKDPCSLVSVRILKDSSGCCYSIYLSNKYDAGYFSGLTIETGHLNIDNVTQGGVWGGITYQSTHLVSFGDTTGLNDIPLDTAGSSGFLLAKICVSGVGPDTLTVRWLGSSQPVDTVCTKALVILGCGVPVDTGCAAVINQAATCNKGVVSMQFQIKNRSGFVMRGITFYSTNPNVKTLHSFLPIADLAAGATSPVYSVPLVVKNGATTGCFYFAACDVNVQPGPTGPFPGNCCMDSIPYCVAIPSCDGCDAIDISATKTDPANCCYKLTLTNNFYTGNIKCVRFNGKSGTQFAILSGWSIQSPVASNEVTMCAPGGKVDTGTFTDFANFCITGTSTPPYLVSIDFLGDTGQVICTKELSFDSCTLVQPTCATIVDDSLYCDGSRTQFSFYVKNYSPFVLYQFDLRLSDTSFKLDKYFIVPNPPIPIGATAGPYVVTVDSAVTGVPNFCMYLSGHNNVYIGDSVAATECCTDSMAVACMPMMSCAKGAMCCQFSGLTVPNGITPNGDGIDDKYVIGNSAICTNIDMVVYNRWGNIVYKQSNYNNTWGGTNTHGDLLPQGTYYVLLKLATGDSKTFYVDIR